MTGTLVTRLRSFMVRSIAVAAVVLAYGLGNVGTQVLSVAGLSGLALATTATPAAAQWRRRGVYYAPIVRRRRYWAPPVRRVRRRRVWW
jgi:hypothetical protein